MPPSLRRCVSSGTPASAAAPTKLEPDAAFEAVPSLGYYSGQTRVFSEHGLGVDNLGGARVEMKRTPLAVCEFSGVRVSGKKGVVVCRRSKRLMNAAETDMGAGLSGLPSDLSECTSGMRPGCENVKSSPLNDYWDGRVAIFGQSGAKGCAGDGKGNAEATRDQEAGNIMSNEGNLVSVSSGECGKMGDKVEVIVKAESTALVNNGAGEVLQRRFTRSSLKRKVEVAPEMGSVDGKGLADDAEVLKAKGGGSTALGSHTERLEIEISKKTHLKQRPNTVRELFRTGLLEGYDVFYKAGKRGVLLRGIIKGVGILCSCEMCKGSIVLSPCKFEIHARKSYKRASQYIFFENGKSLLDLVKECRKCSLETLEETIQSCIGLPCLQESEETNLCQKCKGPLLATSAAKHPLCHLCLIVTRSDAEVGTSEPDEKLNSSASVKVVASSMISTEGRKKRKTSDSVEKLNSSAPVKIVASSAISTKGREKRKVMYLASNGEASLRFSARLLPTQTSQSEISKRRVTRPPDASKSNKFKMKMDGQNLKKFSRSTPAMKFAKSTTSTTHTRVQTKNQLKLTKKDQKMHWMVFEEGGLPDGSEVGYYSHGKRLLVGYKKGFGIFCTCCNTKVTPSQFEAHAGWASRKKPYMFIYTSNGVSLHEFAISLLKDRHSSVKDNDDLCIICADGGKLVLCDGCPRAFHKECACLDSVPSDKWYCKYCENMFQREKFVQYNDNAFAAGRVSGIDPIEQITKRCIRIVENLEEAKVIACVLCRGYDYSGSGFGPNTVILCDQCEKGYHIGCLKKHKVADLKGLPKGKWFCCIDCKRIDSVLQNLLNSEEEKLPNTLSDIVRAKEMSNGVHSIGEIDVRWRLLSGKSTSPEARVLLVEAVSIFHDCFNPIVDSVTGRDFIPSMVYGRRSIRWQDFRGMHCAVLTLNSTVISAAIFRVFGQDCAEIPLVATRIGSQGKGYFQLLFSCIEKLLAFLKVKTCVLPAAYDAMSIWTKKFGFKEISPERLADYRKICWQMVSFNGTSMLEKEVPKCRVIRQDARREM
ncbi:unnamed protein product [Cuscuta campestris]|uniref:PHD-type domain-containing protein n=1 Tax=Cuscuta campestris TaxID=132261 RepID=A0A484K7W7_9ASTE|nr:unnamed protein product [Cuscuta campestris]